ncbi:MAG: putative O-glycosylation ligase, exosortase A system-associated [Magnetococcales bacterium]|nr:putative O-glycosylation ligase, exosortase A system-associated [Magnetococcales bacterium]
MRDLVLTLFIFGMLPVCFSQPRIGLLMWTWVSYMSPHRLTWGFAYDFRFVYIIAIVTILGVIFSKDETIARRPPINAITILSVMFMIWITITTLNAYNPTGANWEWQRFMKIQVMILATYMLITDQKWLHRIIWVVVISICFWGWKGAIFSVLTGGFHRVYGPPGSFFHDNNGLALALVMTVPLIRYLFTQTKNRLGKISLIILAIMCILAILGTYSRGGFLGLAVLAVFFWLKTPRRLTLLVSFAVIAFSTNHFMPDRWKARMDLLQSDQQTVSTAIIASNSILDTSSLGRLNAWKFAVNLANDHIPFGGGFQTFQYFLFLKYAPAPWMLHDSHSIYFEVIGEQGWGGFFIFISLHLLAFRSGSWVLRRTKRRPDLKWASEMATSIQIGLVGYWASGIFLGLAYFDLPYHFISILVILKSFVSHKLSQEAPRHSTVISPMIKTETSIFSGQTIPSRTQKPYDTKSKLMRPKTWPVSSSKIEPSARKKPSQEDFKSIFPR